MTYANVVSTIALFLAVSGATAFAVGRLPERSVGSPQLRPGAVTASKLRKNAVTAPKIKAEAVKRGKLANGSVNEVKLTTGAVTKDKIAAGAVTTEKIAADAVTGAQLDEASLGQVPSAHSADFATAAESANPVAFAAVDQEGNIERANSKGPISVSLGREAGIYCIFDASLDPKGAQVTPRYDGSGGLNAYVTLGGSASCPAPGVEVQTWNGGSRVKAPFYVVLYG
jgi:hypothetical protein